MQESVRERKYNILDYGLLIICLFVSSWYILPSIKVLVPSFIITCLGILFLLFICLNSDVKFKDRFLLFWGFIAIFMLYYLYTYQGSMSKASGIVVQMIVSMTPVMVFYNVRKNGKIKKIFFYLLSIMIAFVILKTLVELINTPGISRVLAHAEVDGKSTDNFRLRNIGGFGHAYGMVFVLITIGLYYRKIITGKTKLFAFFVVVLGIWYIYLAEYFLALILTIVGLMFCCLIGIKNRGLKVILIFLYLVSLLFLPSILSFLSGITEGTVSNKFMEMSQSISLGTVSGSSSTARENVYLQSLEAFFSSPIWGVSGSSIMYSSIGGHSTILDFLGQTGAIGFFAYVVFLNFIVKVINNKTFAYKFVFAFYIVLSILNPTMSFYEISAFIFLYVPLFIEEKMLHNEVNV